MFDDEDAGLVQEPFLCGADEVIERMVADIPGAEGGFRLTFSASPFPGYQLELVARAPEEGGQWYHAPALDMSGWLCPALFCYFDTAPPRLYARFDPE